MIVSAKERRVEKKAARVAKDTEYKNTIIQRLSSDKDFLYDYVREQLDEWLATDDLSTLFTCFNNVMIAREKELCPLDRFDHYWDDKGTKSI